MTPGITGISGIYPAYNAEEPKAPKKPVREAIAPCPLLYDEREAMVHHFMTKFGLSRAVAEAQYDAFC